jgi:hypothetical protein
MTKTSSSNPMDISDNYYDDDRNLEDLRDPVADWLEHLPCDIGSFGLSFVL